MRGAAVIVASALLLLVVLNTQLSCTAKASPQEEVLFYEDFSEGFKKVACKTRRGGSGWQDYCVYKAYIESKGYLPTERCAVIEEPHGIERFGGGVALCFNVTIPVLKPYQDVVLEFDWRASSIGEYDEKYYVVTNAYIWVGDLEEKSKEPLFAISLLEGGTYDSGAVHSKVSLRGAARVLGGTDISGKRLMICLGTYDHWASWWDKKLAVDNIKVYVASKPMNKLVEPALCRVEGVVTSVKRYSRASIVVLQDYKAEVFAAYKHWMTKWGRKLYVITNRDVPVGGRMVFEVTPYAWGRGVDDACKSVFSVTSHLPLLDVRMVPRVSLQEGSESTQTVTASPSTVTVTVWRTVYVPATYTTTRTVVVYGTQATKTVVLEKVVTVTTTKYRVRTVTTTTTTTVTKTLRVTEEVSPYSLVIAAVMLAVSAVVARRIAGE